MGFTFFFRDNHTIAQLISKIEDSFGTTSKIKIWDAGCSNGSEPFTLAIMLAEKLGEKDFFDRVTIYASDNNIETGFDRLVETGEYNYSLLSRMPDGILEKYFTKTADPNIYKVTNMILSRVKFVYHDLLTLKPFDSSFNIVFCKNVLLHLLPAERIEVVKMFHNSLLAKGLYCTEQTQPLPPGTETLFNKVVSDANVYIKT